RAAVAGGLQGAVAAGEGEVDVVEPLAVERTPGEAGAALAARGVGGHHPVALGELGDAGADGLDDTGALVPVDRGREVGLVEDVPGEEVGVAQAGGGE